MKKAQAATEFLVTYGWVILIVLVVIGAMAYFGFVSQKPPERCIFQPGTSCIGKALVAQNNVTFVIVNNIGGDMTINGVQVTSGNCVSVLPLVCSGIQPCSFQSSVYIKANDKFTVVADCTTPLTKGDKYKGDFVISYRNLENGLDTKAMGNIIGIVS